MHKHIRRQDQSIILPCRLTVITINVTDTNADYRTNDTNTAK